MLRKLLEMIRNWMGGRRYSIDYTYVLLRLQRLPNFSWDKWLPLDARFTTTTLNDFRRYAEEFAIKVGPYIRDIFDCDDFSMYFKAWLALRKRINAVAWVVDYSAAHAYNIAFPIDSDPVIIEPQTGQVFRLEERNTRYYKLERYIIAI